MYERKGREWKIEKDVMDGAEKLRGVYAHSPPTTFLSDSPLCCRSRRMLGSVCACALCVAYVCVCRMYCESENQWGGLTDYLSWSRLEGSLSLLIFHSHSLAPSSRHRSRSLQHCKSLDGTWYQELKGVSQHLYTSRFFASSRTGTTSKWEFCYITLICHCW